MSKKYLQTFFKEKEIPYVSWELQSTKGETHFIDNEVVIEAVLNAPKVEQDSIVPILRQIDFHNGDVNHFLKHLAQALVDNY